MNPGRFRRRFVDERWASFSAEAADVQRELLDSIGKAPGSNKGARVEQFQAARDAGEIPTEPGQVDVPFSKLLDYLPRYECVASAEYRNPESMVQRTLQDVTDTFIRPVNEASGERRLLPRLEEVKQGLKGALDEEIAKMKEALRRADPRLIDVEVDPVIDFSRSLTTANLMVDHGEGPRLLRSFGEGTKKKMWMGLLDWQEQTAQERQHRSTLRVYDEPDVNLDYAAERKLFGAILASTRRPEERTQSIVCTHSVTLVDRASPGSINLITVGGDGRRRINYVAPEEDADIRTFLEGVGSSVGLTNSSFFYERCFLIVEGESEEVALPLLYRNLFGRSPLEDGVVIVNMFTCSAWRAVLKVLLRHKRDITLLLLDQDCTRESSSARVTDESLASVGFPESFRESSCFYIGEKEFEDAFRSSDIADVLNGNWPKDDATAWTVEEIDCFREQGRKFSSELLAHVRRTCTPSLRNTAKKPELAAALGSHCRREEQVPRALRDVFDRARAVAG